MNIFTAYYSSPVGLLKLRSTAEHLVSVNFVEKKEGDINEPCNLLRNLMEQLDDYFAGEIKSFNVSLLQKGTSFQGKVWEQLSSIPYGKTMTYAELAVKTGDAKAVRAVAAANGKNNLPIIVPCHRVIGSNKTLTGYSGGLWRKQWLLAHEAKYHSGVHQLF
ncbi:MAG: methylated-DNA--[protein]-cysteine S-methyltransferase [Chitinophagaceae bacterium]